jgi:hypothetical protein
MMVEAMNGMSALVSASGNTIKRDEEQRRPPQSAGGNPTEPSRIKPLRDHPDILQCTAIIATTDIMSRSVIT